ncbi:MAG: hypothetical protein AAB308_13105, partial [Nitrospirota bacterium]
MDDERLIGENVGDQWHLLGPRPTPVSALDRGTSLLGQREQKDYARWAQSRASRKDARIARIRADWALLWADPSFT